MSNFERCVSFRSTAIRAADLSKGNDLSKGKERIQAKRLKVHTYEETPGLVWSDNDHI